LKVFQNGSAPIDGSAQVPTELAFEAFYRF